MLESYQARKNRFSQEIFEHAETLLIGSPAITIPTLEQIAKTYQISLEKHDKGVQKLPENRRCWKRYAVWGRDIYFPGSAVFGESDKSTDEAYFDIVEAAAWSVIAQDYPPTPQQYMYFYRFLKHCNRN